MSTNTIAIGIDTTAAKSGVDDFRASCNRMRQDFEKAQNAAESFNESVASIRRAALDDATDSLAALARVAREATNEVRRLDAMLGKAAGMKMITDGRERVAGLLSDLRQTALAANAAESAMVRLGAATVATAATGGRLQASQARPSLLSGSSPSQTRLASPVIDVQATVTGVSALQSLRNMATSTVNSVRQLGSSATTAAFTTLASAARLAGSGIATIASAASTAGMAALGTLARGAGMALYGIAVAGTAAVIGMGRLGSAALASLGGLSGILSSIGSGLWTLGSGFLNAAMSATKLGLGLVGLGGLSFGFLAKSAIETADAFTLAERKMMALSDGSFAMAAQLTGALNRIADATRSSISGVTGEFNRLYMNLSKTGTSITEVEALTSGLNAAMKLSGATADEAKRAMIQFAQGVGKGKLELQDMKSIAEQSPGLMKMMEEATGKSMAGMAEAFRKGGAEAQATMSRVVSFIANESARLTDALSRQPRTFEESVTGVKNAWFNAVGAMQSRSDFMGPLNAAADRLVSIIGSEGFQRGFASALRFATETAEQLLNWISQIGSVETLFISVKNHLSQIGEYIKAAGKDLKEWATPDFSTFMNFMGPTGGIAARLSAAGKQAAPSHVTQLREEIERTTKAQIELNDAVRAGEAFHGGFTNKSSLDQVKSVAQRGSMTIRTPDPIRSTEDRQKPDRGRSLQEQMTERLNLMRQENRLAELRMTGTKEQVKLAQFDLDVERNITREMWVHRREQAELIVGELKLKQALEDRRKVYDQFRQIGEQVTQNLWDNFMKVGEGTEKFGDALRQTLVQMIKMVAQALILKPLMESIGNSWGNMGSGGGLGSLLGGLFAKGGAFQNGVQMFANGGVVGSPTAFGMSGGRMGVMGEAGPEAIMPLTRLAGGKLGVKASGGGGSVSFSPSITINATGDIAPESVERMRGMVRQELARATPAMTKASMAAVKREHVASGSYLKR